MKGMERGWIVMFIKLQFPKLGVPILKTESDCIEAVAKVLTFLF